MTALLFQLLALYFGGLPACAQTVGATNLLTRGPGAEAAALGNTVVSTVHDPTALYWNPAGLAQAGGMMTGEHLFLYDGARYDFVGLSVPSSLGTFGLGALQLHRDNIVARNAIDDPGSNVSNTQTDFLVGFARMIGEHFAAGGTANVLHFDLAGTHDMGVGLDLGGQAFLPGDDMLGIKQPFWSFGAVVKNLMPPSLKLLEDRETFPRELRGGLSLSFKTLSRAAFNSGVIQNDRASVSLSFRKTTGDPTLHPALGVSYTWNNLVVFRAGYDAGLNAGMGLHTGDGRFTLDYALENKPLALNHRFTLSYRFLAPRTQSGPAPAELDDDYAKALARAQGLSEEHFLRGKSSFKDMKYGAALEPLRVAALLDPDSREKAEFYRRALEVARREKLRQLRADLDRDMLPGREAEAYKLAARMLDLKPLNRDEILQILRTLGGRMATADLDAASSAVIEDRRPEILRFSSQGLVSDALALAANLEIGASSGTLRTVAQLKEQVAMDGRTLRGQLEAQAADAARSNAGGKACRPLAALRRAFPDDAEAAKRADSARGAVLAGLSLTLKERLYLRRLYFLAAVQYANRNVQAARDLLDEILRRNAADADAGALEDAIARAAVVEDQLQ